MIRRLCCTGALVAALLAASVPSAAAATVSPGKWAPKFCTAIDDYQSTISEKSDSMTTALETVGSLKSARAQIVSFLASMVEAAKTAERQVEKAGTPSVPNGKKIEAALLRGLDASVKVFADGKAQAAKISTKNPTAFKTDGKQVGVDLQKAGAKLQDSFGDIDKLDKGKKLEDAVKAAPECAFLTS
jgi:glucose/arabinose dehydrogenase